jgi:hypothetical protein
MTKEAYDTFGGKLPRQIGTMNCVFCFKDETNKTPWCPDNPGFGCQYGLHHDYGDALVKAASRVQLGGVLVKAVQPPKVKKDMCSKCGLHVKNPAAATNGCAHEYPERS